MNSLVTDPIPDPNSSLELSLEDLPSNLLLHILTFLPSVDAVSTSLISQRFRRLWPQLPSLNILYEQFPPYCSSIITIRYFAYFVDQLLLLRCHSSSLISFVLKFPYEPYFRSAVDAWIQYALRAKVRNLTLQFGSENVILPLYDFPFFILRDSRVESLTFINCDLNMNCTRLLLRSMKRIDLAQLCLTDKMVVDLLEYCPNLEEFSLRNACGIDNLRIHNLKLKVLELRCLASGENGLRIELDCPGLVELNMEQLELEKFVVKDLTSLVTLRIWFCPDETKCFEFWSQITKMLDRCPQITRLVSPSWWFKLQPRNTISKDFMLFNLKRLVLYTNYSSSDLLGLAEILDLSPNLEVLTLTRTWNTDEDENKVEIFSHLHITFNLPRLREIKMKRFFGFETEYDFLVSIKSSGVALEKITIDYLDNSKPTTTFKKMSPILKPIQDALPS